MVGKTDFGNLVCKCGNNDITECYRGDEHYYFCDICNKRVEQEQLKPELEAYPGWEYIVDSEGALRHVPKPEYIKRLQEKLQEALQVLKRTIQEFDSDIINPDRFNNNRTDSGAKLIIKMARETLTRCQ